MTDTELMEDQTDPTSELFGIDVVQVDLVGKAANRRKWLLLKSDDELDDEAIDALIEEEVKDAVQEIPEIKQEEQPKAEVEVTKSDTEGGDTMENEELKKAQEEMEVLKKAVADAETAKTEALAKAEAAELIIKEQKKAARQHEVEDLCKSAGLDFETLYKSELADAEVSKHFVGVIETLVKQVNALTEQEKGSAKVETRTTVEKAEALAKEKNIPLRDAVIEISKS